MGPHLPLQTGSMQVHVHLRLPHHKTASHVKISSLLAQRGSLRAAGTRAFPLPERVRLLMGKVQLPERQAPRLGMLLHQAEGTLRTALVSGFCPPLPANARTLLQWRQTALFKRWQGARALARHGPAVLDPLSYPWLAWLCRPPVHKLELVLLRGCA